MHYICKVNKAQTKKQNDMKIQAKDLKVGMTVRAGYWILKIENITNGILKNGKKTIIVEGITIIKHTGSTKTREAFLEMTFKESTKVNVN